MRSWVLRNILKFVGNERRENILEGLCIILGCILKTRPVRRNPPSPTSPKAGTQGAHNPLMAKKSRNQ
jgi:hypothetical protein